MTPSYRGPAPAAKAALVAISEGTVTPAILPATGGTAQAALSVVSPTALPSGTVVQADITETFTLTSVDLASEEQRRENIVVYREPAAEVSATTDVVDRTCSGEAGRLERVLAG